MAEKRMFSSNVIDSDAFLDMSPMARLLYYDMGMRADDDGFIDSPKKIMRIISASDSDLKELIDNGFILRFESGVIAIRHWYVNNRVRRDTYHETIYTEEKSMLLLEKNNVYQLRNDSVTDTLHVCNEIGSQIRGGEDRIDKDRLGKDRLGEGCACVREESSEIQADCLTPPSNEEDVFIYFPTSKGEVPITYKDVDNLDKKYNGAVDVKAEILACAANARSKPNSTNTWEYAVACWIARTLRFKSADSVESENRKMGTRNHRSMEPGKIIEGEEAGF